MSRGAWPPPGAALILPAGADKTMRDEWLARRREGVGGSDVASLLGLDSYHTRWQVWLDKTGQLPDEPMTDQQEEWIEFGHLMEPLMVSLWARRARVPGRILRCGMLALTGQPWCRVNIDRRVTRCPDGDGPCLIECKNRSAFTASQWGASADDIPDAPAVQVQWGLLITGYSHGHLLVVIGGHQLRHYRIEANRQLQDTLMTEAGHFWHHYVEPRRMPPVDASERTGRILAQLWQVAPDKMIPATPELRAMIADARAKRDAAAAAREQATLRVRELQALLGDAEAIVDDQHRPLVTWRQNGNLRAADLARDLPELAAHYLIPASKIDEAKLSGEQPGIYAQYRSRRFLIKEAPNGQGTPS